MTDNNEQHLTPKEFAPHVLIVIAELTEYQAHVSVPMRNTYGPVCKRMGIDEDTGGDSSHGSKFTHRSIGLAMRQLRDRNLTKYAKKGYWTCTDAGVLEAAKTTGVEVPSALEDDALVAARADAAEENETTNGTVVHLVLAKPAHAYSDDPYIRQLAIDSVVCFGAHSKRSKECKSCPIVSDCLVHVGVRKAEIAAGIDAQEAKALALAKTKQDAKAQKDDSTDELIKKLQQDDAPKRNAPEGKFVPAQGQAVAAVKAQVESLCVQCKGTINKGTNAKWASEDGIFHSECIDDPNDP